MDASLNPVIYQGLSSATNSEAANMVRGICVIYIVSNHKWIKPN